MSELFQFIILAIVFLAVLVIFERYVDKKFYQGKLFVWNLLIPIAAVSILVITKGITLVTVQGVLAMFVLLYAANSDIATRVVDDYIPILIVLTALMSINNIQALTNHICAAVGIAIPYLTIAAIKPGCIGGADIKLIAATSLLLGLGGGILSSVTGLILAIVTTLYIRIFKKEEKGQSFAMVPYIALSSYTIFALGG